MHNESIRYAVDRFKSFIAVQKPNERDVRLEAIDLFAQAAGLSNDNWDELGDFLSEMIDPRAGGELGWALVGFMMGLYAAEHEAERNETGYRSSGF